MEDDQRRAAWCDGYAEALRIIRADDENSGTLAAMGALSQRLEAPEQAAADAWENARRRA